MIESKECSSEEKLIVDIENRQGMPSKFRSVTPDSISGLEVNKDGMGNLNMSGSGVFSKEGLRLLKEELDHSKLIIVDTRKETHLYINGMSVSLYSQYNYANKNRSIEEVQELEKNIIQELAMMEDIHFDYWDGKSVNMDGPVNGPFDILTEEELVGNEGIQYWRFYVTDHHGPDDEEIDKFVTQVRNMPSDAWLHFHCRGGVGRTTTFMVLYDMMKNAKTVPCDDILLRQHYIGGRDLHRLNQGTHKYEAAVQRLNTIEMFYDYCRCNVDNFTTTFSNWRAEKVE